MVNLSKVQLSGVSVNQENTLALANFAFDFSVIKVEAPPEYRDLRESLSPLRRTAAENGELHKVARRLTTLFASIIPQTPHLTRAYGERVSEISKSADFNKKDSSKYGAFKDFIGVDGTSIWAAATSGPSAMAIHLLACMLARIWRPSEAVAIWEELIADRRKRLMENASEFTRIEDWVGPTLDITRDQLSNWDASARSWLQAADEVGLVKTKQKQAILILENISAPVNNRAGVYDSVIQAWETALVTMNGILQGEPHSIRDSAVLVALSAWHLFPDIIVVGMETKHVQQRDTVIPAGGTVTIGLSWENQETGKKGAYWSLPLAYLRYYGSPVQVCRQIDSDSSRLSMDDLLIVALGSFLEILNVPLQESSTAVGLIIEVSKKIEFSHDLDEAIPPIKPLLKAAESFDHDRSSSHQKLLKFGRRNSRFLTESSRSTDSWALSRSLCESPHWSKDGASVRYLRELVKKAGLPPKQCLIRVRDPVGVVHKKRKGRFRITTHLHLTTPLYLDVSDHNCESKIKAWGTGPYDNAFLTRFSISKTQYQRINPSALYESDEGIRVLFTQHETSPENAPVGRKPNRPPGKLNKLPLNDEAGSCSMYQYALGDIKGVALFALKSVSTKSLLTHHDWKWDLGETCRFLALPDFGTSSSSNPGPLFEPMVLILSLNALGILVDIYENLPGATISPEVVTREPLGCAEWSRYLDKQYEHRDAHLHPPLRLFPDDPGCFAAVAMLETGYYNLDPTVLNTTMAMSVGECLFISSSLLKGPSRGYHSVRRVCGNIGRGGLAIFVPPTGTKVRSNDPNEWKLVNHTPFDGTLQDSFSDKISLHLSFTGYESPIILEDHGRRFIEAYFIEAVVSAYSSGCWLADLSMSDYLRSDSIYYIEKLPGCSAQPLGLKPYVSEMIAIDNWEELLDPPYSIAVMRTHGNWQARLAATVICQALGHPVIVFGSHGCWRCGLECLLDRNSRDSAISGSLNSSDDSNYVKYCQSKGEKPGIFIM